MCTALPNGSKIAAISSGMSSGIGTTFASGIQTNSPKEPGRLTPTPSVFRQRWPLPARQLRHLPQTICPSPETRSPTWYFVTAEPISAISPQEFVADHHRHRNGLLRPLVPVPDMNIGAADRRLLHLDQHVVRPDLGTGTCSIQSPTSGLALTSALIMFDMILRLPNSLDDTEFAAGFRRKPRSPARRPHANAPPTSACGCAPGPSARPGRRSRSRRRPSSSIRAAMSCASLASPSMTGMIGCPSPASVKPSFVISQRNSVALAASRSRSASPFSMRSNTLSDAAAMTGASVFENR